MLIQYGNQVNGDVEENIFSSGGSNTTSGNIEQAMISQSTATLPRNLNRASVRSDDAEHQDEDCRGAGHDDRVDQ